MEENNYWKGWGIYRPNKLTQLALVYRIAKKICRKCSKILPPDATKCTNPKCHNTDLRFRKNSNHCNASKYTFKIDNNFYNFYNKVKKLKWKEEIESNITINNIIDNLLLILKY